MDHSRLTNIITLKRRQHKDSAYYHAVETDTRYASIRVTRKFKVNEKLCVREEKKIKKIPPKRRKPMHKILAKHAKRTSRQQDTKKTSKQSAFDSLCP